MSLTPQLNELCDMCRGFAMDANTWKTSDHRLRSYKFHNVHDLLLSAHNSCHLCVLIAAELDGRVLYILQKDLEQRPEHSLDQLRVFLYSFSEDNPLKFALQNVYPDGTMHPNEILPPGEKPDSEPDTFCVIEPRYLTWR